MGCIFLGLIVIDGRLLNRLVKSTGSKQKIPSEN